MHSSLITEEWREQRPKTPGVEQQICQDILSFYYFSQVCTSAKDSMTINTMLMRSFLSTETTFTITLFTCLYCYNWHFKACIRIL